MLAFHDADTNTDIFADILARIVARMSACRSACHRNNFKLVGEEVGVSVDVGVVECVLN